MAMYYKQNNEWKKIFVSREETPEVSDESIKKHINIDSISLNGERITPDNLKNVNINAQPYIKELDFINDESEIEKLTIGKLYIVTKKMTIDKLPYYPGSLIIKTDLGIAGVGNAGFVFNGELFPLWSEIQENIKFKKAKLGYIVSINGKETELTLPTKTSELENNSGFVSDVNYIHTDNNYTEEEKKKLGALVNYNDTAIKQQIAGKQDKLTKEQLNNISAVPNKIDNSAVGNGLKFADGMLQLDIPVASASTTYGGGDTQ